MAAHSSKSSTAVKIAFWLLTALFVCNACLAQSPAQQVQSSGSRKFKSGPMPEYPELARKMKLEGIARVLLTVTPEGGVSNVKELGGNPVLVASLVSAVKKWKYEASEHSSEIEVKFEFTQPH